MMDDVVDHRLSRLDGLRIVVLHVLVADASDRIAGAQSDHRGHGVVARNRTANDGPQQHRSQTEQTAAQHTLKKAKTFRNVRHKSMQTLLLLLLLRISCPSLWLHILQMRPVPQVQRGADERMQQQKVGDVLLRDEAVDSLQVSRG